MSINRLELRTQRLVLRSPRVSDVNGLAVIYGDPLVMQVIGDGSTRTQEQVEAAVLWMMKQWEQNGFGLYVVEQEHDKQIIGRCGLICRVIEEQPEVELAYLLKRQIWGRGLATEAAMRIRSYAIEALGFRRLISLVHPDNIASKRVAQKVGLEYEKTVSLSGRPAEIFAG